MNDVDEEIIRAFMQAATESGDPDQIVAMISKLQMLMVSMFSMYILIQAKEHEDHTECTHECNVIGELPNAIDSFVEQLTRDIRLHVQMNLEVNDVVIKKTANQKAFEEIMAEIKAKENGKSK